MGIGRERHGLYYLDNSSLQSSGVHTNFTFSTSKFPLCKSLLSAVNNSKCSSVSLEHLWHQRLGHISLSRMKMLSFLPISFELPHCSICPLSKQTRVVFPKTRSSNSFKAFQLILMDVWGPFNTPTHHGERYFLTIIDDFTRATWVYLMHSKLDVLSMIKNFLALVQTQFSAHVQIIRTDNAMEFFQHECTAILNSLGNSPKFLPVYTSTKWARGTQTSAYSQCCSIFNVSSFPSKYILGRLCPYIRLSH